MILMLIFLVFSILLICDVVVGKVGCCLVLVFLILGVVSCCLWMIQVVMFRLIVSVRKIFNGMLGIIVISISFLVVIVGIC